MAESNRIKRLFPLDIGDAWDAVVFCRRRPCRRPERKRTVPAAVVAAVIIRPAVPLHRKVEGDSVGVVRVGVEEETAAARTAGEVERGTPVQGRRRVGGAAHVAAREGPERATGRAEVRYGVNRRAVRVAHEARGVEPDVGGSEEAAGRDGAGRQGERRAVRQLHARPRRNRHGGDRAQGGPLGKLERARLDGERAADVERAAEAQRARAALAQRAVRLFLRRPEGGAYVQDGTRPDVDHCLLREGRKVDVGRLHRCRRRARERARDDRHRTVEVVVLPRDGPDQVLHAGGRLPAAAQAAVRQKAAAALQDDVRRERRVASARIDRRPFAHDERDVRLVVRAAKDVAPPDAQRRPRPHVERAARREAVALPGG